MRAQHLLLCLAFAAAALPAASVAQGAGTSIYSGPVREGWWGRTALGLDVQRTDFGIPCHSLGGTCEDLSLVGRASVGLTGFNVFGRVGSTTYAKTYALGADSGSGLSYGAGLSWAFSPRASATLAWDTYDLRGASPVRSTSLGLQWRY